MCYQLVEPGSDWRLHRHWYEHSALGDLLGGPEILSSDTLYRCLDKLAAHRRAFFSFLRERWETLFDARFDILLYDLTSTYFESDPPFPDKRRFGHSRDRRGGLRAGGDRAGRDPAGLSAGLRGDAGQHRRQHDAGRLPREDRGAVRALGPGVDHGPGHSDRGDLGGDARRPGAGAPPGRDAEGPPDEAGAGVRGPAPGARCASRSR